MQAEGGAHVGCMQGCAAAMLECGAFAATLLLLLLPLPLPLLLLLLLLLLLMLPLLPNAVGGHKPLGTTMAASMCAEVATCKEQHLHQKNGWGHKLDSTW